MAKIEALLAARLFVVPQRVEDRIYVISDLSGRLSLYAMDMGGSVPEPLLPPHIALQNPHHIDGRSFAVFPELDTILVMIDQDGDENYQPMLIPTQGGFPRQAFDERFVGRAVSCPLADIERNIIYLVVDERTEAKTSAYQANVATSEIISLGSGAHGPYVFAYSDDHRFVITTDSYGIGDLVLWLQAVGGERTLIAGLPPEQRPADGSYRQTTIFGAVFHSNDTAIILTNRFEDTYGLATLALDGSQTIAAITITGATHQGIGELDHLGRLPDGRYEIGFNIDGCSWRYLGEFDQSNATMHLTHILCGAQPPLANGVLEALDYDSKTDSFVLSFSTATSPTQVYTLAGPEYQNPIRHTRERILGIDPAHLSPGEDASFVSHDGLRVSARIYRPAPALGYSGPRPLVYYIHGGPQGQERPDFAWFSMPLIQFLTLNGFAVFVPNVRGSSGYGFAYMDKVTHDWGGQDRLDHVHAVTQVLGNDPLIDIKRVGVMGRSYGGYMTLTLAGRHPELWSAAVDMFGPYDLHTFSQRIPETWKAYMATMVGDPITEADFLTERSPRTYMGALSCPLLVMQGANDPRVVEKESAELVAELQSQGRDVSYVMYPDEGHDVLKFTNKVHCYTTIVDFFKEHLKERA